MEVVVRITFSNNGYVLVRTNPFLLLGTFIALHLLFACGRTLLRTCSLPVAGPCFALALHH